jgi:tetratricopeptide (TPR) repeat protein
VEPVDRAPSKARLLAGSLFLAQSAMLARPRGESRASLATLNALAAEYCARGRVEEAVPLLEGAVAACDRTLGPHDPDTLVVVGNHGAALAMLGRRAEALPILQANAMARAAVLGEDHPATLNARDAVAVTLRLAGRAHEALVHHRRVVEQRERVLGPAHRDSLVSRMGMAIAEADTGASGRAVQVLDDTIATARSTHDVPAEVTALLRANLALLLADQGERSRAGELLAAALQDGESHLGHSHPSTVAIRRALTDLREPPA